MKRGAGKFWFMVPVVFGSLFATAVGGETPPTTAIVDYTSIEQIIDRYLGVRPGESERRVVAERERLRETARLGPTANWNAYVVFSRPVQGTEIQNLVNTYNLTLLSIETNGTAGKFGNNIAGRIDDAELASIKGSVALQVNTAVRALRERYLEDGLASLAGSPDFGIYRGAFSGRAIDLAAATSDPAVRAVILAPAAGKEWKRVFR